ncbi:Defensin domain protein [Aspergillus bombycis]|uniref:Defensin domain protein n=1 Tax=Aspergillus bombycis TaxID=109264 RepID=A0A1F8A9B5_9EURO|nr:Defensin domain protein [Aspergillus bombycis]OGM48287.1 Defensin domain protein [Aspergillus bombycis]
MRFFGGAIATFIVCSSLAEALCHNSLSCLAGGNDGCNKVCERQGNPKGGRCLPRDGCPGYTICACYPKSKRSDEVIDGDLAIREVLKDFGIDDAAETETTGELDARGTLEQRSVCCSLVPPAQGLCCEAHCDYIGKNGGQCSDKGVCTCN